MTAKYNKQDETGRRYYLERLDKTSLTYSEEMDFKIEAPDGTQISPPQPDPTNPSTIWRWSKKKVKDDEDKLIFKKERKTGEWRVYTKTYISLDGVTPRSLLSEKAHGRNRDGTEEIANILWPKAFKNPKPLRLLEHLFDIILGKGETLVDYFAGSGSSGQAIIDSNRKRKKYNKMVLIEMGNHFLSILIPRLKRAIYSSKWKNGKPVSRHGISYMLKYIRLETYEDTLNNLQLKQSETQQNLLALEDQFQEEYMLSYMLDTEAEGSLLSIDDFRNPFSYQLNITQNNESVPTNIDLVETFNYLIGLHVQTIQQIDGFRVVTGTNRTGERILVIWRNIEEKPNEVLKEFFQTQGYHEAKPAFDHMYVNGDCTLDMLQTETSSWQLHLLEASFLHQMFDTQDV